MMKIKIILLFALILSITSSFAQNTFVGSFMHGGIQRTYRVYVPTAYNASVSAPLIINLHGYGSNNIEQELYTNFKPIADTAGFIIVHPNGTPDFSNTLHWNTFGTSNVDDVGFLSALIDTLSKNLNIDQSRVYSTGMSNGGFMSFQLACQLGNRIAAIASVTGTMTTNNLAACQPTRPIAIMQIHGTADATVPYMGNFFFAPVQNLINFWVGYNGTSTIPQIFILPDINPNDGSTAELHTYTGGVNGTSVVHYKVIGGGHSWPGAPININVTNMDFSASAEIWRFFRQYNLNGLITLNRPPLANATQPISLRQQGEWVEASMLDSRERQIRVFDASGREVIAAQSSSPVFRFHLTKKGVYVLITSDGLRSKFILQ
jgi:polyhydroxybutyrate depolymerase